MRIFQIVLLLICSFLISGSSENRGDQDNIESKVKNLLQTKGLDHSQISLFALNTKNSKILLDHNSGFSLAPASGLKLLTTAAALEYLGADANFQTVFKYRGSVSGGVLNGDLIIQGAGDPTFGGNLLPNCATGEKIAAGLKKSFESHGIKSISGDIIADISAFEENNLSGYWNWIDIGNYYGAQTSALCFNENLYELILNPGKNEGDPVNIAGTAPEVQGLVFNNRLKTGKPGSGDNGYIYCAPYQYNTVVRGTVPAGEKEFRIKGSVPDPALFALQKIAGIIKTIGVNFNGRLRTTDIAEKYDNVKELTRFSSPPVRDIIRIVNKRSFNLYAEQLPKLISINKSGRGETENGLELILQFLKKNAVTTEGVELYDGCGLARQNLVTTRMFCELLSVMTRKDCFSIYLNSIALAGDKNDEGFFRNFGTGTVVEKNARIKSGLIGGVRSMSGYLKNKKGDLIAYSMIVNNHKSSSNIIDNKFKELMIAIAEL